MICDYRQDTSNLNHLFFPPFQGAIGCLASITDSSVTKEIFASLLKRFQFIDYEGKSEELKNDDQALDNEPSDTERDSQR